MEMVAKNVGQSIRFILPWFVTLVIFLLIFIRLDIAEIFESIKQSSYIWIACAVAVALIANALIGADKWRVFLKFLKCKIKLWDSLVIRMGTSPIINILPFKLGEVSKIICLMHLHKCPLIKSTSSIVGEYFLNLLAAGLLTCFGCIFEQRNPYHAGEIALFMIIVISLGIYIYRSNMFRAFILRIAKKGHYKVYDIFNNLFNLNKFIGKREFLILFLYSIFYISTELVGFYLLCRAFSISIGFTAVILFLPLIIIICQLPVTILGLGTRELCVLFFFSPYASAEELIGLGMSYSLIKYIMPNLMGLPFTWKLFNKLRDRGVFLF